MMEEIQARSLRKIGKTVAKKLDFPAQNWLNNQVP
jgi:hypothetical protein